MLGERRYEYAYPGQVAATSGRRKLAAMNFLIGGGMFRLWGVLPQEKSDRADIFEQAVELSGKIPESAEWWPKAMEARFSDHRLPQKRTNRMGLAHETQRACNMGKRLVI
jgi:hypothetical protein